jgi:hypothetical protein
MTRLKRTPFALLMLAIVLLPSCSKRPSHVLSDEKMEHILFDLYIAETEINENRPVFSDDSLRRQQLLHSVFKRHKVSEQAFDTSLVWYNANLDKYLKIIENVTERYTVLIEDLKGERDRLLARLTTRDTTLLYTAPVFTLQNGWRDNIRAFRTDTAHLNALKEYNVAFSAIGGVRDSVSLPVFTICIRCDDTTFVYRDTLVHSGAFARQYTLPQRHTVQSVFGHFYLPSGNKSPLHIGNFAVYQQKTTLPSPEVLRNEESKRESLYK